MSQSKINLLKNKNALINNKLKKYNQIYKNFFKIILHQKKMMN